MEANILLLMLITIAKEKKKKWDVSYNLDFYFVVGSKFKKYCYIDVL